MKYSIKELRARFDLTQKECAAIVGTTTPTWNGWEQNAEKIQIKNAIKIAKMFEITLDEIKW